MKKILIINSDFIEQDSVSTISKNIISSYQKIKNIEVTAVVGETAFNSQFRIHYDFIIFVHPTLVINERLPQFITDIYKSNSNLIFYIFGDYVRKSPNYLQLEKSLIGKRVFFYAASESYQKLIKKTLINPEACLKLPFPLDMRTFSYQVKKRRKFREKYNLKKNDFVILYTGRISPQKNIHLIIKALNRLNKNKNLKLFIFGNSDEFETSTFFENKIVPGKYFQLLKSLIKNKDNIRVIPRADHKELAGAYCGCDLFISLSLYHDEDFGYSPLESLCSGTPVIVTQWGGFRDLPLESTLSNSINYVRVNFKENFLEINETQLIKTITHSLNRNRVADDEVKKYRRKYAFSTVAKAYELHLSKNAPLFHGFHENFSNLALALLSSNIPAISQYQYFYKSFWE
ncbi:MAG: glycosyltransferase family 4 protein [Bacteriovorax sp.]|nr:glycosyltransferase family 4 protein [Bacteriovorax sp.]